MSNLYIITVATQSKYYYPYLIESVKKNNNKLKVLGFNQEWKGFNWKFNLMKTELNSYKLDDIVCFVDGFDVICVRNLNEFKNVFIELKKKYNSKIIIAEHKIKKNGIESYITNIVLKIYFNECKNKSLNAGTYTAYVEDLIQILESMNRITNDDKADDQIILTKYCKLYPNNIYIDVNSEIFFTICNPYQNIDDLLVFDNNNIYYNNSRPFFIHGPGETYLDNILIKMNINYNDNICDKLKNDSFKKRIFRLKNISFIYYLIFFIFLILIYFTITYFLNKSKLKKKSYKIKSKK
jgi:hypothetical protein